MALKKSKDGKYLCDKDGNKFSIEKYGENFAEIMLSNIAGNNCKNCIDSSDCYNCVNCVNCLNCTNCNDCSNCDYCKSCNNCVNCKNCIDCNNCYCLIVSNAKGVISVFNVHIAKTVANVHHLYI